MDNSFTATRFMMDSDSGQLTATWSYTNRGLSVEENGFQNAGAHSTLWRAPQLD
jgi:hypothetical protein